MKYITITIRYTSPAGTVLKGGSFPLRGRKPEEIACQWWYEIQKEMFTYELIGVIVEKKRIYRRKLRPYSMSKACLIFGPT